MSITDFKIKVIEKGKNLFESIKVIEKDVEKLNMTPAKFKKLVLDDVEVYIKSNRKRSIETHTEKWRLKPRENLVAVLKLGTAFYQQSKDKWILGIGEKAYLDQYAPYWYKINYGGKIEMPFNGVYGFFDNGKSPVRGGMGGVFHATGKRKNANPYSRGTTSRSKGKKIPGKGNAFLMIPMKPIPPMHYLNRMSEKLTELVDEAWQTFVRVHK